jgi:hypothetical protein
LLRETSIGDGGAKDGTRNLPRSTPCRRLK